MGKVRLLKPAELPADRNPGRDARTPHWEALYQLIWVQETGGKMAAAALAVKMGIRTDAARDLAYRLSTICERKKRADDAFADNALVQSWREVGRMTSERQPNVMEQQARGMEQ